MRRQASSHSPESGLRSGFSSGDEAHHEEGQIFSFSRIIAESQSMPVSGQSVSEVPALGHLIPGVESCVVFVRDVVQQRLFPRAFINLSSEFVGVLADKEKDGRLITRAIEQAEPYLLVHIAGGNQFKSIRAQARRERIHTLWLIPWYDHDVRLSGVFVFASRQVFLPGKQALAAAELLTELMVAWQVLRGQGIIETAEEHDSGILYPFTIIGKDALGESSRLHEDEYIPAAHDTVEQKRKEYTEPDAISVLSHELLSPLTLIKGYAATLLQLAEVITEEQKEQYLQGIQVATDRVIRLLENLRDISRLDIAAPSLLLQPTPVLDIIRKVVFEIQGQTAEHVIKLELPDSLPLVSIDRQKMEQVLTNLLMNAVKYSPQGGDIEVKVWLANNEYEVRRELEKVPSLRYPCLIVAVSDSGIGVPESEQERIFERFYRVNNRLTRTTSGAGLGLHICKIIIEAHHGYIWVGNRIRVGSVFSFSIPLN